jgi:hypothetical protein
VGIDELLAKLPVQAEILRLEHALGRMERIPLRSSAELLTQLPPAYAAVMEELPQLTRYFNPIELITIDDVASVRKRFLRTREEPVFRYERSTAALRSTLAGRRLTLDAIEGALLELRARIDEPAEGVVAIVRSALLEKIDDELATIELVHGLEARDDRAVKRAFTKKYGSVDDATYEAARTIHRWSIAEEPKPSPHPLKRERMSAQAFADAVSWMLQRYEEHHRARTGTSIPAELKYRVVIDPKYSGIDVRDKSSEGPVIGIPPGARSVRQWLGLLRHEIDQHVRQSLNGRLMFGFGGGALKVDEETWYEGLAKHREIQFLRKMFGDDASPPLPYYVFAIRMADEGKSFVEVFETIRDLSSASSAWTAAYRVFRGHSDLKNEQRFGLAKDQAYLRGWILQAQLEARGLGHLNEAAISGLGGLERIARFDFGPDDLLFPDLDLTTRYFEEVMRPGRA